MRKTDLELRQSALSHLVEIVALEIDLDENGNQPAILNNYLRCDTQYLIDHYWRRYNTCRHCVGWRLPLTNRGAIR